jgi:myo-inositol-1-phosphate synthase
VLDVALFLDLAKRGRHERHPGVAVVLLQGPVHAPNLYPEHDLFIQLMKLKNTLRYFKGEELITHLGREYYD